MQNITFCVAYFSSNHIQLIFPHGMRYPQPGLQNQDSLYAQTRAVVAAGEDTKPSSRFFELKPKSVQKMEEQKKSCMTNDSLSPFKVSSKLAPCAIFFFRPNDLHHEPGKTNSPSSVLEEHKANPLWFNTWALPIVEVILPQELGFESHGHKQHFVLKVPCQKVQKCQHGKPTKTTAANSILEKLPLPSNK